MVKSSLYHAKNHKKHIFADGNKRTSFLTTLLFLKKNSYNTSLTVDEGEALIMQITLANDTEDEMVKVSEILQQHCTKDN
ncbi:Fic family protein [[Lactobacillus] timonensis]|uniref:Fic family protein n=1 Tax=[Lactobacillus] timonensis TaxID=1970790 RepID=UPI0038B5B26D